ncbi:hypothetical protein [Adhaeretor mobilis]|uniref:Uncharacterized protein n=1 Tax=Adhaeretor mobilis TaxID=1930276 RepID=A0A517MRV8_9BACT|nr:hypothetical protein [Adhaeretor mobilis]QDS97618.1 hypothetical protein HG15A2_08820 [Adhaeretor mobilis]
MVAIKSVSRSEVSQSLSAEEKNAPPQRRFLQNTQLGSLQGDALPANYPCGALVVRDATGQVEYVQVSRWRRVSAGPRRRIADVVRMEQGNVAVLIEKQHEKQSSSSSVWQVYDLDGHMEALVQCSADGQFGVLLDYCLRDVSRLSYTREGGLQVIERRSI